MNSEVKKAILKGRWIPIVLAVITGAVFIAVMVVIRQGPDGEEGSEPALTVRTVETMTLPFTIHAKGFGVAQPAQSWRAVANVAGRIIYRNASLESGRIIDAGTLLLEIDSTRYELALASAEAEVEVTRTEIQQLDQERANTTALLELERERLALAERELDRARTLVQREALSATRYDEQARATLQQRQAVVALENQLRLIPSRLENLKARLSRSRTLVDQAQEDLKDTKIVAPYAVRIHESEVELHQQVGVGQSLVVADGIEAAEVTVQVQISSLRQLLVRSGDDSPGLDLSSQLDLGAITARVTLTADREVDWDARVERIASGIDPRTRTVQVVLVVDEPYRSARPPARPPLVRGMFVEAVLARPLPEPGLVIPASAVHGGFVYLADKDDRLQMQPVSLGLVQRDLAIVTEGLSPGDRVILDDVVPAVDGMLLDVEPDQSAERQLAQRAEGSLL